MREADTFTKSLFTMRRLDDFVPDNHPLRPVRKMVNAALKNIEPLLSGMYAADIRGGRPSIAPEKLLRAMLLQIFYSIRSERLLMEQTQYNLLFRWFFVSTQQTPLDPTPTSVVSESGRWRQLGSRLPAMRQQLRDHAVALVR